MLGGSNGVRKGKHVWLKLNLEEAIVLDLIFQACLEADGDRDLILPLSLKLRAAKARQEMSEHEKKLEGN